MGDCTSREHFIPLRLSELVDALCAEQALTAAERVGFRQFCQLVAAIYRCELQQLLEKLKAAYAAFDPDSDARPLARFSGEQKQQKLNALFSEFGRLMERANYRHLSRDDLEPALERPRQASMRMDVDFRVFERLAVFSRGDTFQKRVRRTLRRGWRQEEISVPIYQRLVMILKLRPHRRLGRQVDTDSVYFQLFKNIPKLDIPMLLPGARVRITSWDRGKIGLSFFSGLVLTGWRILQEITENIAEIFLFKHPAALWAIVTGTIGYGAKSYFGYQKTKQHYNLSLTQILYFQNLDTNAGVLFRVLDEAEEQECREAILAYYFLWQCGGDQGCTGQEVHDWVGQDLARRANLEVDFEIRDALAKLEKLKIVDKRGNRYRALPLAAAVEVLQRTWAGYFPSVPGPVLERPAPVGMPAVT